jgi:hypothetical protein
MFLPGEWRVGSVTSFIVFFARCENTYRGCGGRSTFWDFLKNAALAGGAVSVHFFQRGLKKERRAGTKSSLRLPHVAPCSETFQTM